MNSKTCSLALAALLGAGWLHAGSPADAESAKAQAPLAAAPQAVAGLPLPDLEQEKAARGVLRKEVSRPAQAFRDLEAEKASRGVLRKEAPAVAVTLRDLEAEKARMSAVEPEASQATAIAASAEANQRAILAIPLSPGNGARILPFVNEEGALIAIDAPILAFQVMPSSDVFGNVRIVPLEKGGRMILPFPDGNGNELRIERGSEVPRSQ
jgi:hypothetical protein